MYKDFTGKPGKKRIVDNQVNSKPTLSRIYNENMLFVTCKWLETRTIKEKQLQSTNN